MTPRRPPDPFLPQLDGYEVHRVLGARSTKEYVCPGCYLQIMVGEGHVVAWPEELVDDRRHWHLHCWRIATRRGRTW